MDSLFFLYISEFEKFDSLTDSQPALFFLRNHDFVKFICLFNQIVLY